MSQIIPLEAQPRDRAGKGAARATRRAGLVPGVIYGDHKDPTLIALDPKVLQGELRRSGFFTRQYAIKVDGEDHRVLPRDVQFHPVNDRPLHVDFLRVSDRTRVHVEVPVHFINMDKSPGIKRGGVLNIVRHEIEVICAAGDIPEGFTIDLDGLDIGDSVHISMVALPPGVRPAIADRDFTIAGVAAPTVVREEALEAAEAEAAAAAAEAVEGEEGEKAAEAAEGKGGEEKKAEED